CKLQAREGAREDAAPPKRPGVHDNSEVCLVNQVHPADPRGEGAGGVRQAEAREEGSGKEDGGANMSGEEKKIVGDSFEAARKRVEEAYKAALQETSSKVERAKSEALRKLGAQ